MIYGMIAIALALVALVIGAVLSLRGEREFRETLRGADERFEQSMTITRSLLEREHEITHEMALGIMSAGDLDTYLQQLARGIVTKFGFTSSWIDARNLHRDQSDVSAGHAIDPTRGIPPDLACQLSDQACSSGKTLFINPSQEEMHEVTLNHQIHALMVIPLGTEGAYWGALLAADYEPRSLARHTVDNLKLLADLLSLAMARHRSQEYAKRVERRARVLLNDFGDAVILNDVKGDILSVNPAFEQIFGYPSDEVIGKNLAMLAPEQKTSQAETLLGEFSEERASKLIGVSRELSARHKDGRLIPGEVTVSQWTDERRVIYACVIRDISIQKRIQREMQHLRQSLEHAVGHRDQLFSELNHALRTPLNSLAGMISLLSDTKLSQEQGEYVDGLLRSTTDVHQVVEDMTDFAKAQANRLVLEQRNFAAWGLLEETAARWSHEAQRRGVELIVWPDQGTLNPCVGDAKRLAKILDHLTEEAVHCAQRGQILLRTQMGVALKGRTTIQFNVSADHAKLPEDHAQFLQGSFDLDGLDERRGGLSQVLSRKIVEIMGGELSVREVQNGLFFRFTLAFPPADAGLIVEQPDLSDLRILILDPINDASAALADMLSALNAEVETCAKSEEAGSRLREQAVSGKPYHLLICSYWAKGFIEWLAELFPTLSTSRTVVYTSHTYAQTTVAHSLRDTGVDKVFERPIRRDELLDAICQKFDKPRHRPVYLPDDPKPEEPHDPHILVVEDNPIDQTVLCRFLDSLDYRWSLAANGAEAIRLLEHTPFDIVLMDCQMPVLDGFATTKRIREREEAGKRQPIVAITSAAEKGDRERCISAGMDEYVTKPVDKQALETILAKYLKT